MLYASRLPAFAQLHAVICKLKSPSSKSLVHHDRPAPVSMYEHVFQLRHHVIGMCMCVTWACSHVQVLERLKEPLKSLMSRDDPATTYAVLAHVLVLAKRAPIIFEHEHTAFYCRAHDPWCVCISHFGGRLCILPSTLPYVPEAACPCCLPLCIAATSTPVALAS